MREDIPKGLPLQHEKELWAVEEPENFAGAVLVKVYVKENGEGDIQVHAKAPNSLVVLKILIDGEKLILDRMLGQMQEQEEGKKLIVGAHVDNDGVLRRDPR